MYAIKKHTSGPASLHTAMNLATTNNHLLHCLPPSPLPWCAAEKSLCGSGSGGLLLEGVGVPGSGVTLRTYKLENQVTLVMGLIVGNNPNISP